MLRLYTLFLAFIIDITLARVQTVKGTQEHLLLQSMSISIMLVFLFYYVCFVLESRKHSKIDELRDEK